MRNMLFSVVLCSIAHAVAAQCSHDAPAKNMQLPAGHPWMKASAKESPPRREAVVVAQSTVMRDTGAMQKTSGREANDSLDPANTMQKVSHGSAQAATVTPETFAGDEPRPRTKSAMLIAALAVMFTIALRRAGAADR